MEFRNVMYREMVHDYKFSHYGPDYTKSGVFHKWITKTSGDSSRIDTEVYAIIENEIGTIEIIPSWAMKFKNPLK